MRWRLKYTPILAMLSERNTPSIHLAPIPIEGASPSTDLKLGVPIDTRVLLAVSVAQNTEFIITDWINWLNTNKTPAEIQKIDVRLESAYMSHSTLIVLSVPILAWSRMVDRDAYNLIGFVRSGNLFRKSEVQDLDVIKEKQSKSRLGLQKLDIDESVDSKTNLLPSLARSPRDSGFEGESDDRDYFEYSDYSHPQHRYSGPIRPRYRSLHSHRYPIHPPSPYASRIPSSPYEIYMREHLTVTSFDDIAHEVNQPFQKQGFREALKDIYACFEAMSKGEKIHALLGLLDRCTKEQQDFIGELLMIRIPGSDSIWDNFHKLLDIGALRRLF